MSALMYTGVIFTCFSLSAIVAPEGKYLMLGAPLLSTLSAMLLASLLNIFIRSHTIAYVRFLLRSRQMVFRALNKFCGIFKKFRLLTVTFLFRCNWLLGFSSCQPSSCTTLTWSWRSSALVTETTSGMHLPCSWILLPSSSTSWFFLQTRNKAARSETTGVK